MKIPPRITDTVAPLGPNGKAILGDLGRICIHSRYESRCVACGVEPLDASVAKQPSPRPTVLNLIADIAAGIRVLNERGMCIPEELIQERAANIVQGLLGNYTITGTGP